MGVLVSLPFSVRCNVTLTFTGLASILGMRASGSPGVNGMCKPMKQLPSPLGATEVATQNVVSTLNPPWPKEKKGNGNGFFGAYVGVGVWLVVLLSLALQPPSASSMAVAITQTLADGVVDIAVLENQVIQRQMAKRLNCQMAKGCLSGAGFCFQST